MNKGSTIYLFTAFTARIRDNLDKIMKEIGLHGGQIFILNELWNRDGLSQADLVKNLNLSAPTVYNMVLRLSDSGFIEIRKDLNDARIMRVFLTPKGVDIQNEVFSQWQKFELQSLANLTEPEKMMFSMLLQKVLEKQQ